MTTLCMASIYFVGVQEATLYYDTPTERTVIGYRRVNPRLLAVETRLLGDFNPEKSRWETYIGEPRYESVEGKRECDKRWAEMLTEVDVNLAKDERNSNYAQAHYYEKRRLHA